MSSALLELLRANPNCRVTISRARPASKKPKPKEGDLKLRGWNWYIWDYSRTREGHSIVNRRGNRQWSWHFHREATSEEHTEGLRANREKRAAKKLAAA